MGRVLVPDQITTVRDRGYVAELLYIAYFVLFLRQYPQFIAFVEYAAFIRGTGVVCFLFGGRRALPCGRKPSLKSPVFKSWQCM